MQIAILTFDGFNELDSFIASGLINRLSGKGWAARITSPTKVCGRLPPRLPCWMRPGRTRRSSSRVVIGRNPGIRRCDGGSRIDFVG